jgi:outer membrane protein
MRHRLSLVLGLGSALFAVPAFAQTQPHTLQEALTAAYSTNPTLLAARAALRATDEGVPAALAGWRPTVVFQGSAGYSDGSYRSYSNGIGATVARNNRILDSAQAQVTENLYNGGKTVASTHSAENKVLSQRGRLLATEQLVFTNVVTDFVNVIQTQQLLQLNINNEQVLNRQLQATNDRFRVGEITRTDVAQAEAALANARATRQTAEGNVQTARAAYQRDVGFVPDRLVEPQPLAVPLKSSGEAAQLASANNPAIIYTMFDAASAKDAVDIAFSALMPTLSAQALAARTDNQTVAKNWTTGAEALLTVTVPIYQGGSEYSRRHAAPSDPASDLFVRDVEGSSRDDRQHPSRYPRQ